MKKFWKLRCCCRSKNFIEPGLQERVIDEGDDNGYPAFQNENTKTATISSPTKYRSSVFLESIDKTSLAPENAKKVEFSREQSTDSAAVSSSIMLKEELSDM
jgi:hypothetical protein